MAKKSGVPVENIASIAGVSAISITRLVGVATRDIGVWPRSGPSCDDMPFSFGEAPGIACDADAEFYSFDSENSLLYTIGGCGEEYAPEGFYVDTFGDIFSWEETDRGWTWSFLGNCEPTPSCDDMSLSKGEFPGEACSASASFYSFDSENSLLYIFGSCGEEYAPEGFYVDNRGSIFWWHLDGIVWVWEFIGPCEPPPSCDTLLLGYTDEKELPPTAACSADPMPYELDPLTNILYTEGGCGDERSLAPGGFYSDGVMIYSIGPEGTFIEVRPCE
jgi:hypothetical protein